jgi:hypothetical protein
MLGYAAAVADVSANLLLVPSAREVTNADGGPPEFGHQFRQPSVGARCAASLRHSKHIQKRLAADTLKAIELDLAADTLQRCQPGIAALSTNSALAVFSFSSSDTFLPFSGI